MNSPIVAIIGAGQVGATTAQRLVEKDIANVIIFDIADGLAEGKALDLMEAAPVEGHSKQVSGTSDIAGIKGANIVVITAGLPRKPGMSRDDLLTSNAAIVQSVCKGIAEHAPNSIIITVTNPLDIMTDLAAKLLGFPKSRVFGMAGVLDSARFCWFLAEETGTAVEDIDAMVLGAHGDSMVPMPRYCTINGVSAPDIIPADRMDAMANRTRKGGAEIVGLLKTGSAFYAPASAAVAMAQSILQDGKRMLPCACLLNGEYGFEGLYMGVPAILGEGGVNRIVEVPLTAESRAQMQKTAGEVNNDMQAMRNLGLL